jgi:mono/diheme cytochrome c family protein
MKTALPVITALLLASFPLAAQEPSSEFQEAAGLFNQHCVKCHTIGAGDRVGPDLRGVVDRRDRDWLIAFIRQPSVMLDSDPIAIELLEAYNGVRMEDVGLSGEQIELLLDYIEEVGESGAVGATGEQPLLREDLVGRVSMPDEGHGPWGAGLAGTAALALLAGACLLLGQRSLGLCLLVLTGGGAYWSLGGRAHHHAFGNQQGYEPEQPIAYSHKLHAGELQIGCLSCHHGAEKSAVAGVPSLDVCMKCHGVVRSVAGEEEPSTEIARLVAAWDSRDGDSPQLIEWVRVHNLPDFVRFEHSAHVLNGLTCQECHGPVQTMERVRQVGGLSMGWCVNCHRQREGPAPTHWMRAEATLDCSTCHL